MTERRLLTTRLVAGERELVEIEQAAIDVVGGPDRGATLALGIGSRTIGSADRCDLVLSDPTVSSLHAEVTARDGGYVVRDLGSKNGILLEGWRVTAAPLASGMTCVLGGTTLRVRATGATESVPLAPSSGGELIARSVAMRAAIANLERFAATEITVLLEGETGAGKEVLARHLHRASRRAPGPFVAIDCGSVTPSLLPSELFGHVAGAFTGADVAREGMVAAAEGGTLFLDEIGELPLDLQPMLLRLLEQKTSRPVGGSRERSHDVRVVAATNRNLGVEVRARRFRQDLYYRLAAGTVRVPPLRDRREDIPLLVERFAAQCGARVSREVVHALAAYQWPGNVRELRNAIQRIAVLPDTPVASLLQSQDAAPLRPMPEARDQAVRQFEREYLTRVMAAAGGNVARAAQLAGVSRQYVHRLVKQHRIPRSDGGTDDDDE